MMHKTGLLLSAAVVASTVAVAGAIAQVGTYDLSQLPETKGVVKQFTLSPRGGVDGLILQDGTEVNFPPHLGTQVVFAIKPGDRHRDPRLARAHDAADRCGLDPQRGDRRDHHRHRTRSSP